MGGSALLPLPPLAVVLRSVRASRRRPPSVAHRAPVPPIRFSSIRRLPPLGAQPALRASGPPRRPRSGDLGLPRATAGLLAY
eukprot:9217145-Alexandrium_andersonii.AAC.1